MMFIGFQLVFLPMFDVGTKGMTRRVADYPEAYETFNLIISLAAILLAASFIPFVWNMFKSWTSGDPAPDNPWRASTLEWQVSSPPPEHNFPTPPEVVGPPYPYGQPDVEHSRPVPAGSSTGRGGGGGA